MLEYQCSCSKKAVFFLKELRHILIETFPYNSPLGTLMISANTQAIVAVRFASDEPQHLSMSAGPEHLPNSLLGQQCIQQLDAYFNGINFVFDCKLEQRGTPFQQKVWEGLTSIETGKTMSYLSFSQQLGNSKAIRAVGAANGKNNIAILVPCHRVIGSNQQLVGYSGGQWRKQWLLQHEARYCNGVQSLFEASTSPL